MPSTYTDRIDGLTTSVAVKAPVRVATTANITLAGLQPIDGVAVTTDDRVLVKSQTDLKTNGIYRADTSEWKRSLDFDGARDAVTGTLVVVDEGDTYAGASFKLTTADVVRFGSSDITFEQVSTFGDTDKVLVTIPGGERPREMGERFGAFASPEDWNGVIADGFAASPTNSTVGLAKAIQSRGAGSRPLAFNGLYATTGLVTAYDGLKLIGYGGATAKGDNSAEDGLSAFGDQAHILKMGGTIASPDEASRNRIDGLTFEGRAKTIADALINIVNVSQVKFTNFSLRNAHGAGMVLSKLEDAILSNYQALRLGYRPTITITGVSKANPAVVTAAGHGLTAGTWVLIDDIVGMTELNKREAKVANPTTSTFELVGVNSSGFTTYVSGGKVYTDQGAIRLAPPLAGHPCTNVVFNHGFRTEWFDGGRLRSTDYENTEVSTWVDQFGKIEVGAVDEYGTHAGKFGIYHLPNDSSPYKIANLLSDTIWVEHAENAACLVRLGNGENLRFTNWLMSAAGPGTVTLFDVRKTDGGDADLRGFEFSGHALRDYNDSGGISYGLVYRGIHPIAGFGYPKTHGYASTYLQQYDVGGVRCVDEVGGFGRLFADPDSADPCISHLGRVAKVTGGTQDILAYLGDRTGIASQKIVGLSSRIGINGIVWVRAKRSAAAASQANIDLTLGGSRIIGKAAITSQFWDWYPIPFNFREFYGSENAMRLQNSNGNDSNNSIFLDAYVVEFTGNTFSVATESVFNGLPSSIDAGLTSITFRAGDLIRFGGSGIRDRGVATSGTIGTLSGVTANTTNESRTIVVSSATNLRVGQFIQTAAGGIAGRIAYISGTSVTIEGAAAGSDQTGTAVSFTAPTYNDLSASFTFDPPSLPDGAGTVSGGQTVTGAALGDFVQVAAPYDLQGIIATAFVSAPNTVKVSLFNKTGGTVDLASGAWKLKVSKG